MAKLKEPPFIEPILSEKDISLSWFEWFRDIQDRTNERPEIIGSPGSGNILILNSENNFIDSSINIATITTTEYVTNQIISLTETLTQVLFENNVLNEAGTEGGSRFGSFRIGLLTEDDYAYFDENGKLIFYGVAGIQLMVPLNSDAPDKFAVFDSSGNLKYRTSEQLADDLSNKLATRDYVAQNYITENVLDEAGTGPMGAHIADADGTLNDITTKFNTLLETLENIDILSSS